MTSRPENSPSSTAPVQASILPPVDLRVRVRPAELARIVGVSRQAVSQWIQKGWVTTFPDGTVNPSEAVRNVLRHSRGRIRAKLLKPLTDDLDCLRRQVKAQTERAEAAEQRAAEIEDALAKMTVSEALFAGMLDAFCDLCERHEKELRETPNSDAWRALLDQFYDDADRQASRGNASRGTGDIQIHAPSFDGADELDALLNAEYAAMEAGYTEAEYAAMEAEYATLDNGQGDMNDAPAGDDLDSLLAGIGEADDLVDAIDAMADADLAALFDELADAEDLTAPDALADGTGGGGGDA